MKMRVLACLLLGLTAGAATAQDSPGDLAKIKGKWTAKVGPNQDIPIVVEFKDAGKIEITVETGDGQDVSIAGEYKIDDAKTPKRIDFVKFASPDGESMPDNLGIYELTGDKMKVCTGGPGNDRPTSFLPAEENGRGTVEFSRVK